MISYNVLRVCEVAEGNLAERRKHAVMRSPPLSCQLMDESAQREL